MLSACSSNSKKEPVQKQTCNLSPDFISVTYSVGGSDNSDSTIAISSTIKKQYHIESVAHLTCISQTKEEVLFLLERLKANNIENILALRGDINPDIPPKQVFKYASDLISFIKENSDFNIIAACYPEGHSEAVSITADIRNLKIKVENGVDYLKSRDRFRFCVNLHTDVE